MEAIAALAGALIGGTLVLVGDLLRQRVEWHRENVRRLADASIELARLYNRMCGELLDARFRGVPLDQVAHPRPERFEAMTQFFMTPGADLLRPEAVALAQAHWQLLEKFVEDDAVWDEAAEARFVALRAFEAAVRTVIRRGRL